VVRNERQNMTNNQQLELGFNANRNQLSGPRSQHRSTRAAWWFARMRQAVDGAFDWQPTPTPPPQQIEMPGTHREIQVIE